MAPQPGTGRNFEVCWIAATPARRSGPDTAYRSKTNEAWLEKNGYRSDFHRKKPKGRPMAL